MKKRLEINIEEEKGKVSGSIKASIGDEDLFGFLKGSFDESKKEMTIGLKSSDLGEFGILYENGKPIEAYYQPSRKVKVLGYSLSLLLGWGTAASIFGLVPEPYRLPVTLTAGAIISGFFISKILNYQLRVK